LVLLSTGEFKGLKEGSGDYELTESVWNAIGEATAASWTTIPSVFGPSPPNVAKDKLSTTADLWSFWMLYLGLALLSQRFRCRIYFDHFIDFVKLVRTCLQFEISQQEIQQLRVGFADWVIKYKR
jgi:hypothetical protein